MYLKIHRSKGSEIVALCDENLVGKKIEEGNKEINVTDRFYKGEILKKDEVVKILLNATNINAVGEEAVKMCVELGLVDKDRVLKIKGIPHAQIITT